MTDYELYPIKKDNLDWPLYLLVSSFMYVEHYVDIHDETICRLASVIDKSYDKSHLGRFCFIFPSVDYSVKYPAEILTKEAAILYAPFSKRHEIYESMGSLEPDDEEYEIFPSEYFHCIKVGEGFVIRHFIDGKSYVSPKNVNNYPYDSYNGDEFLEALNGLIRFLEHFNLYHSPWYERLQTTRRMLEGDANELHILHNAGLYDIQNLYTALLDHRVRPDEMRDVMEQYHTQLKLYAMFVLNTIDWDKGSKVLSPDDKKNKEGIYYSWSFEDDEDIKQEIARRKEILSSASQSGNPLIREPEKPNFRQPDNSPTPTSENPPIRQSRPPLLGFFIALVAIAFIVLSVILIRNNF